MDDALKNLPVPAREGEPARSAVEVHREPTTAAVPAVLTSVAATAPVGAQPTKSALPPYLHNNSWEEELNYKLWVTSSARFRADKRCCLRSRWSQLSVTLLTSYLIIIGILPLLPSAGQFDFNFSGAVARIHGFPPIGDVVDATKPFTSGLWNHIAVNRDPKGRWDNLRRWGPQSDRRQPVPLKSENLPVA